MSTYPDRSEDDVADGASEHHIVMSGAFLSEAPPLYLDWLDLDAAPGLRGISGRFGMTILPGRRCQGKTAKDPRDLGRDAASLVALGVDAFVLLVEDHEMMRCGVPDFSGALGSVGIPVFRCPIVDHWTPDDSTSEPPLLADRAPTPGDRHAFDSLVIDVERRLREGQTIAVACHGGLGRTGTLAACMLKRGGLDAEAAIATVRRSRPGAIDHQRQEAFIRGWSPDSSASQG